MNEVTWAGMLLGVTTWRRAH